MCRVPPPLLLAPGTPCACLVAVQDPSYLKSYYRRGSANMLLCKYKEARSDFLYVTPPNVAASRGG